MQVMAHTAPTSSAMARYSAMRCRSRVRSAGSGWSMLRQPPTSASSTSSATKASRMARIRSPSSTDTRGQ